MWGNRFKYYGGDGEKNINMTGVMKMTHGTRTEGNEDE